MTKLKAIAIALLLALMVTPIMAHSMNGDNDSADDDRSAPSYNYDNNDSSSYYDDDTSVQSFNCKCQS